MVINKKALGVGILAVLGPFLVSSEKSLKSIVDEWFETCSIVVDLGPLSNSEDGWYYPIELFVQGTPPILADLVVSSDKKIFKSLVYLHDLESNNRSLHPSTPNNYLHSSNKNISVPLSPFRKNLLYSFKVYVEHESIDDQTLIGAFVRFPKEIDSISCRVEKGNWFNILVGGTSLGRFLFILIVVFVISLTVTLIKSKQN